MGQEKLMVSWESCDNNVRLVKKRVQFKGSKKHCMKEACRWLLQQGFGNVGDFFEFAWFFDPDEYNIAEKRFGEKNKQLESMASKAKSHETVSSL